MPRKDRPPPGTPRVKPLSPALKLYLKAFDEHNRSGSQVSRDVMTAALYGRLGREPARNGVALNRDDALENVLDGVSTNVRA